MLRGTSGRWCRPRSHIFTFYPSAASGYPVFAVSVNVQASGTQDIGAQVAIALPAAGVGSAKVPFAVDAEWAFNDGTGTTISDKPGYHRRRYLDSG